MAGVEDAELALDYIVEHAEALKIDPQRVGMGGTPPGVELRPAPSLADDATGVSLGDRVIRFLNRNLQNWAVERSPDGLIYVGGGMGLPNAFALTI